MKDEVDLTVLHVECEARYVTHRAHAIVLQEDFADQAEPLVFNGGAGDVERCERFVELDCLCHHVRADLIVV